MPGALLLIVRVGVGGCGVERCCVGGWRWWDCFINGVLDVQNANQEFTDAILRDQSINSLMKLLQLIGYRRYLAGVEAA